MNFIFLVLLLVAIIGLFIIKYEVRELDKQLALKNSEVIRSELTIKVLKADWSVLNEPERLRKLGSKHLVTTTNTDNSRTSGMQFHYRFTQSSFIHPSQIGDSSLRAGNYN